MEKVADAVYFKDTEGRFLWVSNRIVGMFNMDHPSQVEGKTAADFFSAQHAAAIKAVEADIMKGGLPVLDVEEKQTWPDGSVTWASTSRFPLYDGNDTLIGTFGISRDITDKKLAEEELARAHKELIEQEKRAAVSEFASTIFANIGSSVLEIHQTLDKALETLRRAKTSPEAFARTEDDIRELRFVVRKMEDLMKIQAR